jgi:flagellar hook protein FlgE
VPSIVNGLFSGRSGISSHGIAIAVIGDNIANASTIGYKTSRAEFSDLIAGGQTSGKVIGSGSQVSSVSTIFEQGTSEFTGRPLDLTVDGNGFFVLGEGQQRFYTRAGNFKLDESGNIVNQNGLNVLGFPSSGSGALEVLNVNQVSQDSVNTRNVTLAGNVDASADLVAGGAASLIDTGLAGVAPFTGADTYSDLSTNPAAALQTVVDVFDSLGAKHTMTLFFYHTDSNEYSVRAYVNSTEVDAPPGSPNNLPRQVTIASGTNASGTFTLNFNGDGTIDTTTSDSILDMSIQFNNGSDPSLINVDLSNFTQYSGSSSIGSIVQDGKGVGTVTSLSVEGNGDIFAILSNGQTSIIGTVGLVNFANPEGLVRIGDQLLQQAPASGEPIVGHPDSGTLGAIAAGTVELSTVDIANEFVKLITLQRGFQANSRIITTINQLLNDIIQLA